MKMVEVDLVVNNDMSPPPSLGIRVVGVNMCSDRRTIVYMYTHTCVHSVNNNKTSTIIP